MDRIKAEEAWKKCKAQCDRCASHGYPDGQKNGGYTHSFGGRPDWACYAEAADMDIVWKYLRG